MFCCSLNNVFCTSYKVQLKMILIQLQKVWTQKATMAKFQKISMSKCHFKM